MCVCFWLIFRDQSNERKKKKKHGNNTKKQEQSHSEKRTNENFFSPSFRVFVFPEIDKQWTVRHSTFNTRKQNDKEKDPEDISTNSFHYNNLSDKKRTHENCDVCNCATCNIYRNGTTEKKTDRRTKNNQRNLFQFILKGNVIRSVTELAILLSANGRNFIAISFFSLSHFIYSYK